MCLPGYNYEVYTSFNFLTNIIGRENVTRGKKTLSSVFFPLEI